MKAKSVKVEVIAYDENGKELPPYNVELKDCNVNLKLELGHEEVFYRHRKGYYRTNHDTLTLEART